MSYRLLLALCVTTILITCTLANNKRVVMEQDALIEVPRYWSKIGKTNPQHEMQFIVRLKLSNVDKLKKFVDEVSNPKSAKYGKYMTLDEVHEFTAPKYADFQTVASFFSSFKGVTVKATRGNAFLQVSCIAKVAEKLFRVKFFEFEHAQSGVVVHRSLEQHSLPFNVAAAISVVSPIFRFPRFPAKSGRELHESAHTNVKADVKTTPAEIQKQYSITVPPANDDNLQAVTSFLQQYYSSSDLSKFQEHNSLPQMAIEKTIGPNDPAKPGVEASLDVQFLTGVNSDTIRTWVWSTAGIRSHGNEPFLTWLMDVDNTTTVPYLFSISYQDLEYTVTHDYANSVDEEFMKNNARGITFLTGSGDWGVGCHSPRCTTFTSDFPSSSQYVTSVGGTVNTNEGEIGVEFSSGGFSNYFPQPSFQSSVVSAWQSKGGHPFSSFYNISGRAFPDVSAVSTNFQVVIHGFTEPVAGTSASTPTFASMISMINSMRLAKKLPVLGNINQFLYSAYAKNSQAFKDITANQEQLHGCCSKGFNAIEGWDPVTGLGTPNFPVLSQLAMDPTFFNFN